MSIFGEECGKRPPCKQINASRSNINSIIETKPVVRGQGWNGGKGVEKGGAVSPVGVLQGVYRGQELCCRDIVLRGATDSPRL